MFLGSLQRVAEVIDQPLEDKARAALESGLRYFQESAPKHTADEEDSLFPRLRQIGSAAADGAIKALDLLEHDHEQAGALHAEIHDLGIRCLRNEPLSAREAAQFRRDILKLAGIYEEHIRVEDRIVFPAADQALSASEKTEIAHEMAARRGVTTVG